MGGEEVCLAACLGVVLFTLMVFSGVALTNVGPEQEIEIPLTMNRVTIVETSSSTGPPISSSNGGEENGARVFQSLTVEVQFDVDNNGEMFFKQKRAKRLDTGEEVKLDNKGSGKRVKIPFPEVFNLAEVAASSPSPVNKDSRSLLSFYDFSSSRWGSGLKETIFGDGIGDGADYNQTAAVEWVYNNKFQWLCPNYYFQLEERLHRRWQAALLRFLPQILFAPIWIVSTAVSKDCGAIVGVIGSAISFILMFTGVVLEFAGLSKINTLLDAKSKTVTTSEFCGNGFAATPTLGSQGFVPEMSGVGVPTSAGLTFIPLIVCGGVLVYAFTYVSWSCCCRNDDDEEEEGKQNPEEKGTEMN